LVGYGKKAFHKPPQALARKRYLRWLQAASKFTSEFTKMENWNSKSYLKNYSFDFCAIKKMKVGVNKIDKNSIEKIEN
jgi:hypothetical protein